MSAVASRSSTDRAIFNGMFSAWPKDTGFQYDQDFARKSSLWSAHHSRVRSQARLAGVATEGRLPAISNNAWATGRRGVLRRRGAAPEPTPGRSFRPLGKTDNMTGKRNRRQG